MVRALSMRSVGLYRAGAGAGAGVGVRVGAGAPRPGDGVGDILILELQVVALDDLGQGRTQEGVLPVVVEELRIRSLSAR